MNHTIEGGSDYGHLSVRLDPEDRVLAERGTMSWMSTGMTLRPRIVGGLAKGLLRKMVLSEPLIMTEFSHSTGGDLVLAPTFPGSIIHILLDSQDMILSRGAFMACMPGVKLSPRLGGLRAMLGGKGLFLLNCSGTGNLFFSAFGGVVRKQLHAERLLVDADHVLAWDSSLRYTVRPVGGIKATLLSGEGLAIRFEGSGNLYLQSRTVQSVANWMLPFLNTDQEGS